MTRDEFMDEARKEIDDCFRTQRNRLMNLVERAWAEGKRNAEVDGVVNVVKYAMEKLENAGQFPTYAMNKTDWMHHESDTDGIDCGG